MAKTNLNTIKNWFKTGLKPTQAQFWNTWDSFWHKDDTINISDIEGLQDALDQKATAVAVSKVNINGVWFDTTGNTDRLAIEVGNKFEGYDGDYLIMGIVTSLPFDITDSSTYKTAYKAKAI